MARLSTLQSGVTNGVQRPAAAAGRSKLRRLAGAPTLNGTAAAGPPATRSYTARAGTGGFETEAVGETEARTLPTETLATATDRSVDLARLGDAADQLTEVGVRGTEPRIPRATV